MGRLISVFVVIFGFLVLGYFLDEDKAPNRAGSAANKAPATATVTEVAPSRATTGQWRTSITKNPLDDTSTVVVMLEAQQGRGGIIFSEPIQLYARCKSNKTEVYVNWHDYLGDDSSSVYEEWKWVIIRIGDGQAQKQKWSISTDTKATFAPRWAGDLLK